MEFDHEITMIPLQHLRNNTTEINHVMCKKQHFIYSPTERTETVVKSDHHNILECQHMTRLYLRRPR